MSEPQSRAWSNVALREVVADFIVPMRDKPKSFRGKIPWCRIEDFDGMYLSDSKSMSYVDDQTIKEMNLKVFPKGTVLCSCSATLGRTAIVARPLITNQTFIGLLPNPKKLSEVYLYYTLNHLSSDLQRLSTGTTIAYLPREKFEGFEIPLPPIVEQKKIAEILSAVDRGIEVTDQLTARLEALHVGLVTNLLFRGPRNKGWQTIKLGEFAEFRNGVNFGERNRGTGVKIIGVSNFKNYLYPIYSDLSEINPDGVVSEEDFLKENDFLFVRSNGNRELIGRCLHIKDLNSRRIAFSGFVIRCRVKNPKLRPDLLAEVFRSSKFRATISGEGAGTNISNLSQGILADLDIPIPPSEEQKRISSILSSLRVRMKSNAEKARFSKNLKTALMSDLLSGRVRVKV